MKNVKINAGNGIIINDPRRTLSFEKLTASANPSSSFTVANNVKPAIIADVKLDPRCAALQDYLSLINWGKTFLSKQSQMKLKISNAKNTYIEMSKDKSLKTRADLCIGIAAQFYDELTNYLKNPTKNTIYSGKSIKEIIEKITQLINSKDCAPAGPQKKQLKSLKASLCQIQNDIKRLEAERAQLKVKCEYDATTEQPSAQNNFPSILPRAIKKAGEIGDATGKILSPVGEGVGKVLPILLSPFSPRESF
jgi:hypothetical protein